VQCGSLTTKEVSQAFHRALSQRTRPRSDRDTGAPPGRRDAPPLPDPSRRRSPTASAGRSRVLLAHAAPAEHSFNPHRRKRGGAPHDRLPARSTHTVVAGSPAEFGSRQGGARCRRFAARRHLQHLHFRTLTRRRSPPRPPAPCASTSMRRQRPTSSTGALAPRRGDNGGGGLPHLGTVRGDASRSP
jgi:hypothetical protein